MRCVVLLVAIGCGSARPPEPITNTPPTPASDAMPSGPPIDVGVELKAIATARVPKPVEIIDPGGPPPISITNLPAFGNCVRPDPAEQTRLRTRIESWLRTHLPRESFETEDVAALGFGCVEAAGTIVDVVVDTRDKPKRGTPPTHGHWVTVRVGATGVTLLIEATGIPSTHGAEWALKTSQTSLAIADLDHDGILDPISINEVWDVGDVRHYLTLTTVLSTGASTTHGPFGDYIELAAPASETSSPVIRVRDERDHEVRTILRCIDDSGKLPLDCPALAAVRRHVEADVVARELASSPVLTTLDRDRVRDLVDLFEVPEPKRSAMIAAVPVMPSRVVAREVDRWARHERGADSLLWHERDELQASEERRLSRAAFAELGDTECVAGASTPALEARIAAFVNANDRRLIAKALATDASFADGCKQMGVCTVERPTRPVVAVPCATGTKRYVTASWQTTAKREGEQGVWRAALFYFEGDRMSHVFDRATMAPMCCSHEAGTSLDARFYRHGDNLVGTVLVQGPDANKLVTVVDGVIGETRTGSFERYAIRPLLVDRAAGGAVWHAGPALHRVASLDDTKPGSPLGKMIFEREQRTSARDALIGFDRDLRREDERVATIGMLTVLGAPRALIDRVRDTR